VEILITKGSVLTAIMSCGTKKLPVTTAHLEQVQVGNHDASYRRRNNGTAKKLTEHGKMICVHGIKNIQNRGIWDLRNSVVVHPLGQLCIFRTGPGLLPLGRDLGHRETIETLFP
jgi:hypothetical protein